MYYNINTFWKILKIINFLIPTNPNSNTDLGEEKNRAVTP